MTTGDHTVGLVLLVFGGLMLYLLPTLVALWRGQHVIRVFALNLLTGWTIGGWLVSMGMAIW